MDVRPADVSVITSTLNNVVQNTVFQAHIELVVTGFRGLEAHNCQRIIRRRIIDKNVHLTSQIALYLGKVMRSSPDTACPVGNADTSGKRVKLSTILE